MSRQALFADAWASGASTRGTFDAVEGHRATAVRHRASAANLTRTLNARLWRADLGYHAAWNVSNCVDMPSTCLGRRAAHVLYAPGIHALWRAVVRGVTLAPQVSSRTWIEAKTYVIAMPLWATAVNASPAATIAQTLRGADMLSEVGLRSTSSDDPRYSNEDMIVPYSNWRGPMWVNANVLACYGLAEYGHRDLALEIATRVVRALAADLRLSRVWHEAYSTADGRALAAPGFLSWDTLSAELLSNLQRGVNPFKLAPKVTDKYAVAE